MRPLSQIVPEHVPAARPHDPASAEDGRLSGARMHDDVLAGEGDARARANGAREDPAVFVRRVREGVFAQCAAEEACGGGAMPGEGRWCGWWCGQKDEAEGGGELKGGESDYLVHGDAFIVHLLKFTIS